MPEGGAEQHGRAPLLQELHEHPGLHATLLRVLHRRPLLHPPQDQDGPGGLPVHQRQKRQEGGHGDPDLRLPHSLPPRQRRVAALGPETQHHEAVGQDVTVCNEVLSLCPKAGRDSWVGPNENR